MTSTTATATPAAEAQNVAEDAALPTLERVAVADLVIGDNIRKKPKKLKATFVDSLRRLGNFDSIIGYRREDGKVVVIDGQRRTLGLRAAGREQAKVELWPTKDGAMAAADRIEAQYLANEEREPLTESERVDAIADMLELGISEAQTSKRLSVDRAQVKAVRALTKSDKARALVEDTQLSLTEAAAADEFADDDAAAARLVAAAGRGMFAHTLEQLRAERDAEAALVAVEAAHAERGFEVLADDVSYTQYRELRPMRDLVTAERKSVTVEEIGDPSRWSVFLEQVETVTVLATGEQVDEEEVDWRTSNDPTATPRDGLLPAVAVRVETVIEPSYYCRDFAAEGLSLRYRHMSSDQNGSEDEAAAARAEAAAEAKRAEARRSKLCNEVARPATTTRRNWLRDKLAEETLPAGSLAWAVGLITDVPGMISENAAADIARDLLGRKGFKLTTGDPRGQAATDRAPVVVVALAAGAIEARMQPNTARSDYWRGGFTPAGSSVDKSQQRIADWLALLTEWGYTPSRIELVAMGKATADEVAAEVAAAKAAKRAAAKAAKKKTA
ncbi:ParB/RepB/Spo0J family partition protein [Nocardia salmonicida]|uniref:ParB/RepB/Spo0J family partition protein n=1 Tax=Nocardia salmonicida TaxID=53431 RepID=UPI0033D53704